MTEFIVLSEASMFWLFTILSNDTYAGVSLSRLIIFFNMVRRWKKNSVGQSV